MAGYVVKVERIAAPRCPTLWVDLLMDKRTGIFSAHVGGESVAEATKEKAVAAIEAALGKVVDVVWRPVILLRVDKRRESSEEDYVNSHENNLLVYGASCTFTYARRERSTNPLKKKPEPIEREHQEDFELRVKSARERTSYFESGAAAKRKRMDEAEEKMRADRAAMVNVQTPWMYRFDDARQTEHELPYTPEAWAGIQKIATTLREMQARLDGFAAGATVEALAQLVGRIDVFKSLPAAK